MVSIPDNLTDTQVLGLTLWAEARSQPIEGIIAVANVIRNRLASGHWGHTYTAVCLAPKQFSCWNEPHGLPDVNHARLMAMVTRVASDLQILDRSLIECLYLAEGIVSARLYRDNTLASKWYLTATLYHANPPAWAAGIPPVATIGDHVFLNRVA